MFFLELSLLIIAYKDDLTILEVSTNGVLLRLRRHVWLLDSGSSLNHVCSLEVEYRVLRVEHVIPDVLLDIALLLLIELINDLLDL